MKKSDYNKTAALVLLAAVALLFLSACSGVIGGDTTVRISVPGMSSGGRFISATATNGYVVVLDKNKIYSLNSFDDDAFNYLVNGQVYITNLPTGDYIFGVALLGENDENFGFAVKEWTVEKGFNEVPIQVAPGIVDFTVDDIPEDISNPFDPPEGVYVEFAEDTIILDYGRTATPLVTFDVTFGDGTVINTPPVPVEPIKGSDPVWDAVAVGYIVQENSSGIVWKYSATVGGIDQDFQYRIILK